LIIYTKEGSVMLKAKDIHGVIPAIVTPFTSSDEVDVKALKAIIHYALEEGVHGIMTTGGNGEFCSLLREERRLVHEVAVQEVSGHVPVIACTAACSTRETILLTKDAYEVGVDAAIVTPPYFFRLPPQSLYDHYRDLAAASDIPVIVYNNPLYTGNNLSPQLFAQIAEIEGIIGLKQSNSDLGQFVEIVRLVGDDISLCTGIDSQFYPSLCVGGGGIFSTAACVIPREMVRIYEAFQAGDYGEGRRVHDLVQVLNRFLEYDPGYVAPCKFALGVLGYAAGRVRMPLPELTQAEQEGVRAALAELGYHK
jgi:4-hydroxy-tetrahydrodipicolinate synthase